jgi:hypothetical protein
MTGTAVRKPVPETTHVLSVLALTAQNELADAVPPKWEALDVV